NTGPLFYQAISLFLFRLCYNKPFNLGVLQ
ncbi:MAG: hypothetical protein ACI8XB_002768, partial [Patiriisocius sp.]